MKKEEITKVIIGETDIINLIKQYLLNEGLSPIGEIRINISTSTFGLGASEYTEHSISDTTIECRKTN